MMESKSTSCWSAIVYPHLPGERRATLYVVVVDARQSKGGVGKVAVWGSRDEARIRNDALLGLYAARARSVIFSPWPKSRESMDRDGEGRLSGTGGGRCRRRSRARCGRDHWGGDEGTTAGGGFDYPNWLGTGRRARNFCLGMRDGKLTGK